MDITITTPLYYVNDKPHLGSTYTTIASDAFARFKQLEGNNVILITGVDEHGQKIQRTAETLNINPITHCDNISTKYLELWDKFDINYNRFIRTTSEKHIDIVNHFFTRIKDSGDIKIGIQKGWYCVGCEEYKDEPHNSNQPECSIHKKRLEWRDEENLFFCLSNYQEQIDQLVRSEYFVQPKSRRNEIINFVSQGLRDFSISRQNVEWGIPVPGYKNQTLYVWFDALLGYLSALTSYGTIDELKNITNLGWPANVHVIGKDILRFHAVYWPAMLMSAHLPLPKSVFGHGFLTREGQKMGKSLGNVLDPNSLLDEFGNDPIRWYLLSDIKFGSDGDFQKKRFVDIVNNDLANTIGNLLNRTSSMARKWFSNSTPYPYIDISADNHLKKYSIETIFIVKNSYECLDFKSGCEAIMNLATEANSYLNQTQPWSLIKIEKNNRLVSHYIYNVLETCRIIALLLLPIVPQTSKNILNQLQYDNSPNNWDIDLTWGLLKSGQPLPEPSPILKRIELDI